MPVKIISWPIIEQIIYLHSLLTEEKYAEQLHGLCDLYLLYASTCTSVVIDACTQIHSSMYISCSSHNGVKTTMYRLIFSFSTLYPSPNL